MQPRLYEPAVFAARKVRADAWLLLEQIKTTPDQSKRRELARQAFKLAQKANALETDDRLNLPLPNA